MLFAEDGFAHANTSGTSQISLVGFCFGGLITTTGDMIEMQLVCSLIGETNGTAIGKTNGMLGIRNAR